MGVFATRTPHRPNPIGLTVAKVESVQGHMVLLSGVDLVDGTPVLDVKPYLPYSDANQGATVPEWVKVDELLAVASVSFSEGFFSTLSKCWVTAEKSSLYTSHEFQNLIMQVLSWDIRSSSQRNQPHEPLFNDRAVQKNSDLDNHQGDIPDHGSEEGSAFIYHLMLEDLDVSYKIDGNGHVVVERVELSSKITDGNRNRCTYKMWKDKLG